MEPKLKYYQSLEEEIQFIKNERSKNYRINVEPFKAIQVSIPRYGTYKAAYEMVDEKLNWIKQARMKTSETEAKRTIFKPGVDFKLIDRELEFIPLSFSTKAIRSRLTQTKIKIYHAGDINFEDEANQEVIREVIEKALRVEAKKYLEPRLEYFANKFGFYYNRVVFKNAKTRWGSCSADNNINLSIHLIRLPKPLADYVILHELTHTKVKNHGKMFWAFLESVLPGARELDKELNNYRIRIW